MTLDIDKNMTTDLGAWSRLMAIRVLTMIPRLLLLLYLLLALFGHPAHGFISPKNIKQNELCGLKNPFKGSDINRNPIVRAIVSNPLSNIISNTYSFFYTLPRKNMAYDLPWKLFKNSTADLVSWYQIPHNLPPYRFLTDYMGYPADFFCFGLPGATLPMGNFDPCAFSQVSPKVVRKYRESELKHGRLAMLAAVGMPVQELFHPVFPEVGGLAVYQMSTLSTLSLEDSKIFQLFSFIANSVGGDLQSLDLTFLPHYTIPDIPVDYISLLVLLATLESHFLKRNWTRWRPNEYYHQFDHNMGVGNLKEVSYHEVIITFYFCLFKGIYVNKFRIMITVTMVLTH